MEQQQLKEIIEALLLSSNEPLSLDQLLNVFEEFEKPSTEELKHVIECLIQENEVRSFELVKFAKGYQMQTKAKYAPWISRLNSERPAKYSRALLEILAIIAYKQPVTRADIEEIRGVAVNSQIMKTLLEREWIRVAGHRDVAGKPAVYTTTKEFLDYFNLRYLQELPPILPPTKECIT